MPGAFQLRANQCFPPVIPLNAGFHQAVTHGLKLQAARTILSNDTRGQIGSVKRVAFNNIASLVEQCRGSESQRPGVGLACRHLKEL